MPVTRDLRALTMMHENIESAPFCLSQTVAPYTINNKIKVTRMCNGTDAFGRTKIG